MVSLISPLRAASSPATAIKLIYKHKTRLGAVSLASWAPRANHSTVHEPANNWSPVCLDMQAPVQYPLNSMD